MAVSTSISFRGKVFSIILLIMGFLVCIIGYAGKNDLEQTFLREKQEKLMALANVLASYIPPEGFQGLLLKKDDGTLTRESKIIILNQTFAGIVDAVGNSARGLGAGVYSSELDAIVAYGPIAHFGHFTGRGLPEEHGARAVISEGNPAVITGMMAGGHSLVAILPIVIDEKPIGMVWICERLSDVRAEVNAAVEDFHLNLLILFILAVVASLIFLWGRLRRVDDIVKAISVMRREPSYRLAGVSGEFAGAAENLNALGEKCVQLKSNRDKADFILETAINKAQEMVYVCDPVRKELLYASETLLHKLGCPVADVRACYDLLHKDLSSDEQFSVEKFFNRQDKDEPSLLTWEVHNNTLGRDFFVSFRRMPISDEGSFYVEVGVDATWVDVMESIQKHKATSVRLLASIGSLLAVPAASAADSLRFASQSQSPEAVHEYLPQAVESVDEILRLSGNMLDFTDVQSGLLPLDKHSFDPRALVDNITAVIGPRAVSAGLDFHVVVEDSVPGRVYGDCMRLAHVLVTLLENSIIFALGGYIHLTIDANMESSGMVRLIFKIKDSGLTIPEEELDKLFDPFLLIDVSGSRRFNNAGLELAACKGILSLMDGRVSIGSHTSGFEVSVSAALEVVYDPRPSGKANEIFSQNADCSEHLLLLIDENRLSQRLTSATFASQGYRVHVAATREEAMELFIDNSYSMVFIDGNPLAPACADMCKKIRSSGKEGVGTLPIVGISFDAPPGTDGGWPGTGLDAVLSKPVSVSELRGVFGRYLPNRADT